MNVEKNQASPEICPAIYHNNPCVIPELLGMDDPMSQQLKEGARLIGCHFKLWLM